MGRWPVNVEAPATNTTALGHALASLRALLIEAPDPEAARQAAKVLIEALVDAEASL